MLLENQLCDRQRRTTWRNKGVRATGIETSGGNGREDGDRMDSERREGRLRIS